jgi:hypothetical protein
MTDKEEKHDNIFFSLIEEDNNTPYFDLNEINELLNTDNNPLAVCQMINYKENYTVKELLLICEYYGFAKDLKNNKCNKDEIVQFLVLYETNIDNVNIVSKRKNLWFYMNEIKNDKFMKKYVLW